MTLFYSCFKITGDRVQSVCFKPYVHIYAFGRQEGSVNGHYHHTERLPRPPLSSPLPRSSLSPSLQRVIPQKDNGNRDALAQDRSTDT